MVTGRAVTEGRALRVRAKIACGIVAAPVFVSTFTVAGARRPGYDSRRHAVSSLSDGPGGWTQRVNFIVVGCALLRRGARARAEHTKGRGALRGPGVGTRHRSRVDRLGGVRDRSCGRFPAFRARSRGRADTGAGTHSRWDVAQPLRDPDLRRHPHRGLDLRGICSPQTGVSLGCVLLRLSHRDDRDVHALWRGVRRRRAARRARGCVPARLDRHRIRMAERALAPRATTAFVTSVSAQTAR